MTNITTIVVTIVTNWSTTIIPPEGWESIQKMRGVPNERYRAGVVEEVRSMQVDWKGSTKIVELERKRIGFLEQKGSVVKEVVDWKKATYKSLEAKKEEPAEKKAEKRVAKKPWWKFW